MIKKLLEEVKTKNEARGRDIIQITSDKLDSLSKTLNPKSNLAKSISKDLGKGFLDDFKKMSESLDDIMDVWQEVEFAVAHDTDS